MNIERLPSGSYRIRQTVNGIAYKVTVDHKPSQAEAFRIMAEKVGTMDVSTDMPFKTACDLYIASKSNVLSVSSIRGYRGIMGQISHLFMGKRLSTITLPDVQTEVNRYSVGRSPKSVYNMSGFVMGVLKYYGLHINSPKLPQNVKKSPYIPTKEEVRAILERVKGTKYEVPIKLAVMGLRRSEICALTLDDLDGDVLTISKAKVENERHEWEIKTTKTEKSTRSIRLPADLVNLIHDRGLYIGHPEMINRVLQSVQKELGIEPFTLHKLRHFCVSYLHDIGCTDSQIQEIGGFKTDRVMKTVYRHAMEMDEVKKAAADSLGSLM